MGLTRISSLRDFQTFPLYDQDSYTQLLANKLVNLKPSFDQYKRNMLWLHVLTQLIEERHLVSEFTKHQLKSLGLILRQEAKVTSKGDLYLYLKRLVKGELNHPLSLEPYQKESLMAVTYLVGNCDELEEKLDIKLRNIASNKARVDINIYLSSCITKSIH